MGSDLKAMNAPIVKVGFDAGNLSLRRSIEEVDAAKVSLDISNINRGHTNRTLASRSGIEYAMPGIWFTALGGSCELLLIGITPWKKVVVSQCPNPMTANHIFWEPTA